MRLISSDPDVETVVSRIQDGSIDLQPDFQRGSVWSRPKQRLLIDSILRGWYVPPVHLVRTAEDGQIVLDGQQRLNSIYEFAQRRFTVDGKAAPASNEIMALDGLYYDELPVQARRRFDRFSVRVFEVVDYRPEEPYELFYRLNQPTPLTAAEKRNAFFGPARAQIRELTERSEQLGMSPDRLGFSNARLAYEDLIARFVWTLEKGTLDEKVTANRVTERYREPTPFPDHVVMLALESIGRFVAVPSLDRGDVRLNRAMVHSWLCFVARGMRAGADLSALDAFVPDVEVGRQSLKSSGPTSARDEDGVMTTYSILNDRSTSRVNDASSVLLRDAALWALFSRWHSSPFGDAARFASRLAAAPTLRDAETGLLELIAGVGWGTFL